MKPRQPQAVLVLPHLLVQNANAISSAFTHGFPSITAFIGLMWALQRKLIQRSIPLRLLSVGVICHQHQEQINQGYVRTFNLSRNPLEEDGSIASIVEEGRMHFQISLVLAVTLESTAAVDALQSEEQRQEWACAIGEVVSHMRVAGGTLLPSQSAPGKSVRPWIALIAKDQRQRQKDFRRWRRQWLPGFALVARDDVLSERLAYLRQTNAEATLLDAWLHASRFNYEPLLSGGRASKADGKVRWGDPLRPKGSGWIVPIPVGYAGLTPSYAPGEVANARDLKNAVRFVESVYSIGEWVSVHRLTDVQQLLWWAHTHEKTGLYRCHNDCSERAAMGATSESKKKPQGEDEGCDQAEGFPLA